MSASLSKEEVSEQDKLSKEKIFLAKKLGIWGTYHPVKGFEETAEYQRIKQIDQALTEIING